MPFGLWTRLGRRKHVLHGAHWRHLANTIELSVCVSDAALCQITLTTCYYTEKSDRTLEAVRSRSTLTWDRTKYRSRSRLWHRAPSPLCPCSCCPCAGTKTASTGCVPSPIYWRFVGRVMAALLERSTDVSDTAAAAAATTEAFASLLSRYRRPHPFVVVVAASCSNASRRRLNSF